MKTLKINKTTENFLNWSYKGDGKYYTTEQGSRSYRNSTFQNFINKNNASIQKVLERGNDAPRGGQTGNFMVVEFTEDFKIIAKEFFAKKQALKDAVEAEKQAKADLITSYANLIVTIEGEDRVDTEKRLSQALNEKISATIFHKAVSEIRNRK